MNKNDIVYIGNDRCRPCGLSSPLDDAEYLRACSVRSRGDLGPLRAMKAEGRVRLLEHMARAEVLHLGPRGAVVEVLTGSDRGDFVWVSYRDLVEQDDPRVGLAAAFTGPAEPVRSGTSEPLPPPSTMSRSEMLAAMRRGIVR